MVVSEVVSGCGMVLVVVCCCGCFAFLYRVGYGLCDCRCEVVGVLFGSKCGCRCFFVFAWLLKRCDVGGGWMRGCDA